MDKLSDGAYAEFEEYLAAMGLNRPDTDEKLCGDLLITFALGEKLHYLYFAGG